MITEDDRRSIGGRAATALLRASAKLFSSGGKETAESEMKKGRKMAETSPFTMPKDRKADYDCLHIAGYPCLCMRKKGQTEKSRKAILFLHGGLQNVWKPEIGIARGYMERTGCDLRYPVYPSLTEVPATESIRVCFENYRQLADEYGAENTVIVGSSFGGYYAMQIINRINLAGLAGDSVRMPDLVIALSPAGLPDTADGMKRMEELSHKDPMISFRAMMTAADIIRKQDADTPDYTLYPALLDLRNAPPTYIYYGEETVCANAPCYLEAFENVGCGDRVFIRIQKGMMHDYACMPVFPESRRSYEEQIRLILQAGEKGDSHES